MESLREIQVARNLLIDIDELTAFVKEGKQSGYASGIKPIYDPVTQIKRLVYHKGPWLYIDEYRGSFMAPGTETVYYAIRQVYWDDNATLEENLKNYLAIWQMNYAGGMLSKFWQNEKVSQLTYGILKEMLKYPSPDLPLRGPGEGKVQDPIGRYSFGAITPSDITFFSGMESIWLENHILKQLMGNSWPKIGETKVFQQYICGSIIVYNHAKV